MHPNQKTAVILSILIAALAILASAGGLLLKDRYRDNGILSIKGPLYTLVLAVNSILVVNAGISNTSELPLWASLTVLGTAASVLLFGHLNSTNPK